MARAASIAGACTVYRAGMSPASVAKSAKSRTAWATSASSAAGSPTVRATSRLGR